MTPQDKLLQGVCDLMHAELPRIRAMRRSVSWKPDGSPVTEADVYVEDMIRAHLGAQFNNLRFVGEESFVRHDESPAEWTAVLDPIDGTENFCSGFKEWGMSLSIWQADRHWGSLLLLPELNDRLISGQAVEYERSRVVGFSSSLTPELTAQLLASGEGRIFGCAVYNLFNVVRGALARFTNPAGARAWDIQAGLILALEHRCDVSVEGEPYDGRYLRPDRKYRIDVRHRYDLHPG